MTQGSWRIGTAGWAIPRTIEDGEASALERYARRLDAAEINTTFYRPPRASTFERWRSSTPSGFKFSVKAPKRITHEKRLAEAEDELVAFIEQVRPLEDRLGPILFQLPPSLVFERVMTEAFLAAVRRRFAGPIAWEPRHGSWLSGEADRLLGDYGVARVAADPARAPGADQPGGTASLAYFRLHGSPRIYYSAYGEARLAELRQAMETSPAAEVWVIFDNTASGAAITDALSLLDMSRPLPACLDRTSARL